MKLRARNRFFLSALVLVFAASCGDGVAGGAGVADYGDVGVGGPGHTKLLGGVWHMPGNEDPLSNCVGCHGAELEGGAGTTCYACHDNDGHNAKRDGFYHRKGSSSSCNVCHGPNNSGGLGPACAPCHKQHD